MRENEKAPDTEIPDDNILTTCARLAVKQELEKRKLLGQPIAKVDPKTGRIYIEFGDGSTKEYGKVSRQRFDDSDTPF